MTYAERLERQRLMNKYVAGTINSYERARLESLDRKFKAWWVSQNN